MRVIFLWLGSLFILNCSYAAISNPDISKDTILISHTSKDSLIAFNYRMLPAVAKYAPRFKILSNVNSDYRPIFINYSLQNFIKKENFSDSALLNSLNRVNANMVSGKDLYTLIGDYNPFTEKELFYGVWRAQLTKSSSEAEIRQSVINGTNALIDLGYSDMARDFFPFITALMEEQHLYNYDLTRTSSFSKGSRGIVTSVEILNALGSQDFYQKFGVCRDIHETARELIKPMCEVYFDHFYPDKNIDFDEYLFLQSWTTDASQHVTLSLINPLDTKVVYELDWGRVIEKTNISGYNNGRLYGNTFRIWQYDKEKHISVPIDFKRTQFGKILDEDILTPEEYQQFNGIYDEEYYSNIRYLKKIGKYGNLNFSAGGYYPGQKYFLTSWFLNTERRRVTNFLKHSNTIAFQIALHEDTRKKALLYPQRDWQSAYSIMGVPRLISKFETKKFEITRNITFDAYLNQQLDIFLIVNSFHINDTLKNKENTHSGDGNISFSNGFNFDLFSDNKRIFSSLTLQARSCLLPKDIRLFSPNPAVLLSNIRFITPAIDVISNTLVNINEKTSISVNAMIEFTNKDAILFSGSLSAKIKISENLDFVTSVGGNDQLKGMHYFWYPVSKNRIDFQVNYYSNVLSLSLLKMPDNRPTINISFRRYLQ